ncbi:MAG: ABC transporter ATP-binding protein [Aeromicrobium sp.]|nr:MAG: ABC transporter ATP-binding protein [Aeromicrobium sp.]
MTSTVSPVTPVIENTHELVISATDLSKRFGSYQAISHVSMQVRRGQAFGLLGPNGAGKTTTVRLLNHVISPDNGEVLLFGEKMTAHRADRLRTRIGVQTDTNVYENLTARENLMFWARLYGLASRERKARVDEVLDIMGLAHRARAQAGSFSKGMRQKLAVGRAILHRPELLFLDEPTTGLDPQASAELISHLEDMVHSFNTTLVMCTHQLAGLADLCKDVGFLVGGRMEASGPVEKLVAERWPGHHVRISLGAESDELLSRARTHLQDESAGISCEIKADRTLHLELPDESFTEGVIASLVAAQFPIRSVVPVTYSIKDLYFDIASTTGEVAA